MDTSFCIRDCSVVVGVDLSLRADVDIVVQGGMVTDIGPGAAKGQGPSCPELVVFPGLLNGHTHLGDACLAGRGFGRDPDSLLWPPDGFRHRWMAEEGRAAVVRGMRNALVHAASSGTVAVADFRENGLDGVRQLREAADGVGVETIIFGRHEHFPLHSDADLEANSAELSADQLAEIGRVLDEADGFSPLWANDTTDAGLGQTARLVRGRGKRLATHAGETARYRETSRRRTGTGDVERILRQVAPDFIVHMTSATREEFRLLAEADTPVVMCPRTQAALGIGIPPMLDALDEGVAVALGTDNAMATPPDILGEMVFYARALRAQAHDAARPTAKQLLTAATVTPAAMLGLADTHGQVDVGRPATFFLFDTSAPHLRDFRDPVTALVTVGQSADVTATVVAGECISGRIPGTEPSA